MIKIIQGSIIPNFILVFTLIIIWHKLLDKKINFKNWKLYITIIGIMILSIANYFIINNFVKIALITIIFMIFFAFLFKENVQKCIITPIFYQLIIMVSETIYALIITIFKIDINITIKSFDINMISNIFIAIISIIISYIKITKKIYKKLLNVTDKINKIQLSTFCIIIIIIANILSMIVYYQIKIQYLLIFNVSLTLLCCYIVFYVFKTQNKYNKVNDKYNIAINSLTDYEEMMKKYRINNHENKNLLLAVRAMIVNNEKDIPIYIDSIIKDKYNDNEKLLLKVNKIPSGGLRATIYSEILKIKDKKINYELIIDNNIKTIDLINIDTNTIIDICKILGVFIDNAIEEVSKIKNKHIGISLYINDNKLVIGVSNTYDKKIEVDKIYNEGYTTKGKGHGYGLSLVKKIIDGNNIFENKISINKSIFTQILCIQYKKSHK